jgi:hypothetical protein
MIRNNTVSFNENFGIYCSFGCTIIGNRVDNTWGSGASGISTFGGSTILDNSITFCAGSGLSTSTSDGYARNVIVSNGSTVTGGGFEIGTNLCGTNTSCP